MSKGIRSKLNEKARMKRLNLQYECESSPSLTTEVSFPLTNRSLNLVDFDVISISPMILFLPPDSFSKNRLWDWKSHTVSDSHSILSFWSIWLRVVCSRIEKDFLFHSDGIASRLRVSIDLYFNLFWQRILSFLLIGLTFSRISSLPVLTACLPSYLFSRCRDTTIINSFTLLSDIFRIIPIDGSELDENGLLSRLIWKATSLF